MGYHKREIARGVYGELSKIREELEELEDAAEQGVKIMEMAELADLYGAIYLRVRSEEVLLGYVRPRKDERPHKGGFP